ncbi:hypothetical protein [Saccharopolyspora mangrovi]|uniref:Uncharacterized protein n=1 Tax=Saccharopolyspora mangrovi TaxID=3082379 RepID=A0ABU6A3B0_9PSEU|nr:hypothetical protein [Saccharopolyspora sp. S2-29]MEB3366040.1 hypothetical protein [Saccharopolyspora sp. S2-29]
MGDLAGKLDKSYEGQTIAELADAPVAALKGVSDSDAEQLKSAFGIKTVRDLGTNKYFLWAQSIAKLAE